MKTFSDSYIKDSLISGNDSQVIKSLYSEVFPSVKNYILSNSGNEEEAYDLFQDAMVLFYNQVRQNKFPEKYKVKGFLFTVSKNLWINRTKKLNRNVKLTELKKEEFLHENVIDGLVSEEKRKLVFKIFETLDAKCIELLKCSIFYKMSMEDIAIKLGFASADAAKTQNYRCKKVLSKKASNHKLFKELKELYYGS